MRLKKKQIKKYLEKHPDLTVKQIRVYWSAFELFVNGNEEELEGTNNHFNNKRGLKGFTLELDNESSFSQYHDTEKNGGTKKAGEDNLREEAITIDILDGIMRRMFQNPTETELLDMVREVDSDQSGLIEFDEFIELMSNSNKKLDSKFEMTEAFKVFDQDGDGVIKKEELQRVFSHIGCYLTEEECEMMIKEVDTTYTGCIHYDDFVRLMVMSQKDILRKNETKNHLRRLMFQFYEF